MTLAARFAPLPPLEDIATRWHALEQEAQGSFFLGWTWTGAWLESYGAKPELLTIADADGRDVALALIGHAMAPRLLGRTATLLLNQAGEATADRPFIEYNGLLARVDRADAAQAAMVRALDARRDWRVLRLSGIDPESRLLAVPRRRAIRADVSPVYQVDLDAVRGADGDYLSLLSTNTRSQIRRSMKDHGGNPPVAAIAVNMGEVDLWLGEMQALNAGRHSDNAWDDPAFRAFVRALALRGLSNGEVEVVRLTGSNGLLGLLVNFVYRGVAMNYQSAFAAPLSPKDKPGLLCHMAAVGRYADAGHTRYSLLAGKDRYKQSLATCEESLEWWVLERFSPRLEIEALLRRLFRRPVSA